MAVITVEVKSGEAALIEQLRQRINHTVEKFLKERRLILAHITLVVTYAVAAGLRTRITAGDFAQRGYGGELPSMSQADAAASPAEDAVVPSPAKDRQHREKTHSGNDAPGEKITHKAAVRRARQPHDRKRPSAG